MKTISDYIESLFIGIQETETITKMKEDLLAGAEDRYDDLIKQGKNENEAIGTVISEFGSIDELLEEMNLKQEFKQEQGYDIDEITSEEANEFINIRRQGATLIGLGVVSILLGGAFAFAIPGFFDVNDTQIAFSLVALFIGTLIGVPLFIIAGMKISNSNQRLDDRFIPTQVKYEMKKRKETFQRSFIFCMTAGVIFCIVASMPPIISISMFPQSRFQWLGLSGLFLFASVGVFLFIFGGVIMGYFTSMIKPTYFISNEDKLGPRARAERDKNYPNWFRVIVTFYWPCITCIFFFRGFILADWENAWSTFVFGGIIYWVLTEFLKKKN